MSIRLINTEQDITKSTFIFTFQKQHFIFMHYQNKTARTHIPGEEKEFTKQFEIETEDN